MTSGRPVVVVLGMHRAGTSMLARILHDLGVDLGQNLLIKSRPDNLEGYWEHAEIVGIQQEILTRLHREPHRHFGTLPLPLDWLTRPWVSRLRDRLQDIVAAELAQTGGIWGFKDPRTARLLPLWNQIFSRLGVEPRYLLSLRHPIAVAHSLHRRQGMSMALGQLAWLRHMLDAVRDAGDSIRTVVDYDTWFAEPRASAEALVRHLGLATPDSWAWLDTRISPELRHHHAETGTLLPVVDEAYRLLRALNLAAPPLPLGDLYALEARVREAEGLFSGWMESLEAAVYPGDILAVPGQVLLRLRRLLP